MFVFRTSVAAGGFVRFVFSGQAFEKYVSDLFDFLDILDSSCILIFYTKFIKNVAGETWDPSRKIALTNAARIMV